MIFFFFHYTCTLRYHWLIVFNIITESAIDYWFITYVYQTLIACFRFPLLIISLPSPPYFWCHYAAMPPTWWCVLDYWFSFTLLVFWFSCFADWLLLRHTPFIIISLMPCWFTPWRHFRHAATFVTLFCCFDAIAAMNRLFPRRGWLGWASFSDAGQATVEVFLHWILIDADTLLIATFDFAYGCVPII